MSPTETLAPPPPQAPAPRPARPSSGAWSVTRQGVATVARLELRQRIRSTRWIVSLVVFGLLVGGVTLLTWLVARTATGGDPGYAGAGPTMFGFIVFFVLFLGLLVSPTLSATSINGDRAAGTLATLQVTLLSAAEIALGKLLAAWLASLAFLGVSTPFIAWSLAAGGVPVLALVTTLLLLAVLLAVVCAIGLGFSALTARTAGSAVLTYVAVASLSVLSPILFGLSIPVVSGEERVEVYGVDWSANPDGDEWDEDTGTWIEPECEVFTETQYVVHTERTWWLLAVNPFVIVADAAPAARDPESFSFDPLTGISLGVRAARLGQGPEPLDQCWQDDTDDAAWPFGDDAQLSPVWPWGLAANLLLGAGGVVLAVRRLQIPHRTLAKGTRVA